MIITGEGSSEKPADKSKESSKLIIDESWKEKAQKEKEKLADANKEGPQENKLPPASFLGIVEEMAVRAMLALGQFRDPNTNEVYLDLDGAKYVIDNLVVLEQKTKGNLDASEADALKSVLHNLRLTYVQISKMAAAAAAGVPPAAPSGQEPGKGEAAKPGPKIIY